MEAGDQIPKGIWTLADLQAYSREKGICPYFAIRRMVSLTHCIVRCSKLTDALRGCHHLLIPLSARSEGSRASIEGIVEGCDRRF